MEVNTSKTSTRAWGPRALRALWIAQLVLLTAGLAAAVPAHAGGALLADLKPGAGFKAEGTATVANSRLDLSVIDAPASSTLHICINATDVGTVAIDEARKGKARISPVSAAAGDVLSLRKTSCSGTVVASGSLKN